MSKLAAAIAFMLAAAPVAMAQDKAKDAEKKTPVAAEKSAKEPSEKQKAQQARMQACNDKAAGKTGDERKAFMGKCLKGEDLAAGPEKKLTQQDRMATCNKQAGEKALKGDERKKFMSECLKG